MEEKGRNRPSGGRGGYEANPSFFFQIIIRMKRANSFMPEKVDSS